MPDNIKNDRYFAEGFRELDESLAETTAMLAEALPLDAAPALARPLARRETIS